MRTLGENPTERQLLEMIAEVDVDGKINPFPELGIQDFPEGGKPRVGDGPTSDGATFDKICMSK